MKKSQTYEQKKEAIYKYRETHLDKWRERDKLLARKYRKYASEAKILRNILINFFED